MVYLSSEKSILLNFRAALFHRIEFIEHRMFPLGVPTSEITLSVTSLLLCWYDRILPKSPEITTLVCLCESFLGNGKKHLREQILRPSYLHLLWQIGDENWWSTGTKVSKDLGNWKCLMQKGKKLGGSHQDQEGVGWWWTDSWWKGWVSSGYIYIFIYTYMVVLPGDAGERTMGRFWSFLH